MPQHSMAPMLFGLRVVMLGRQGSGKGTQGVQLARLLVVPQISVGDVLREAAKSGSPAGCVPPRRWNAASWSMTTSWCPWWPSAWPRWTFAAAASSWTAFPGPWHRPRRSRASSRTAR